MKNKLAIIWMLCLFSTVVSAQLKSVITTKESELSGKLTKFIAVDEATGYAMGKESVKYDAAQAMPQVYFTKAPTELLKATELEGRLKLDAGNKLVLAINDANNTDEGFWSLYFDGSKDLTTFCRRRFVKSKARALWQPLIFNDKVVFKAIVSKSYLVVDENGKLALTHNLDEASRWELVYTK